MKLIGSIEDKKNSEKSSLVISIISLIFGSFLATNPGGVVDFISYIIGGLVIVIGIARIISFINMRKKYNINKPLDLISGIIFCILGLIACIWGSTIETLIRIIVGAWILYCGITKLITALSLIKTINTKNIVVLILAVIIIIIGLATIMIQFIEFKVLGIIIIAYSIADIVEYVLSYQK